MTDVDEVNLSDHLDFKINTYVICANIIEELTTR